jgi:hypothetical protein
MHSRRRLPPPEGTAAQNRGDVANRRAWHEGTKCRRPGGLYGGRVLFDGKRYQVTATEAKERDRLLWERVRGLEESEESTNLPHRKTVAQVAHDYLAWPNRRSPTYPGSRSYLERHVLGDPLPRSGSAP